jgi:hypothetical protein
LSAEIEFLNYFPEHNTSSASISLCCSLASSCPKSGRSNLWGSLMMMMIARNTSNVLAVMHTITVLPPADLPAVDVLLGSDCLTRNSVRLYYVAASAQSGEHTTAHSPTQGFTCYNKQQERKHTRHARTSLMGANASKLVKNGASYFLALVHSLDTAPSQCPLAVAPALSAPCQSGCRGLAMAAQAEPPDPSTISPIPSTNLPECIKAVLRKHEARFEPSKNLPPDRHIGHTIPLPPGHSLPFRQMYRMSTTEREHYASEQSTCDHFYQGSAVASLCVRLTDS